MSLIQLLDQHTDASHACYMQADDVSFSSPLPSTKVLNGLPIISNSLVDLNFFIYVHLLVAHLFSFAFLVTLVCNKTNIDAFWKKDKSDGS